MTIRFAPSRIELSTSLLLILAIVSLNVCAYGSKHDKLTPEEIVAKSVQSIGKTDAIKRVRTRIITGNTHFSFRATQTGAIDGNAVIASTGPSMLLGMAFATPNYPFERVGFDGRRLTTGYTSAGVRTTLGNFVLGYPEMFREGLFGGVLSSTWPMLDSNTGTLPLEYAGEKKISSVDFQILRYMPRKGTDLAIRLYFDAATFQHVRTEYERTISASLGNTPDTSSQQRTTLYRLTEEFSDFKTEDGLNLPHRYKVDLFIDGVAGTNRLTWDTTFKSFMFNQPIPQESFNVEQGPAE